MCFIMNNITIFDIANFFLSKKALTHKKLQKLVYYAYAWFIALNNENKNDIQNILFDEQPEAWLHGPVFPSLYNEYKYSSWNEIKKVDNVILENEDLESFLNDVWNKFGEYSADQLEYMTHQETPWKNARKNVKNGEPSNNKILLEDIFVYYNGLIDG